jgi:hypothetical protein
MNSLFVIEVLAVVVVAGDSVSLSLLPQLPTSAAPATVNRMTAPIFRMMFPPLDTGIRETVDARHEKFAVLSSEYGSDER